MSKAGKRPYNEDFVYPDEQAASNPEPAKVFIVCDGVGGSDKGEVASQLVGVEMYHALKGQDVITDDDIQTAIGKAQVSIDGYIADNQIEQAMATTMTLVGFVEDGAVLAHIGDSRIYHVRNNTILFRTEDHSLVNEMVVQSLITEEEAKIHPQKNVITRAISGTDLQLKPDIHRISDIRPKDYFFLCTDGVLESIDDNYLVEVLANQSLTNHRKIEIIDALCSENSRDNYSLYLLQVETVD